MGGQTEEVQIEKMTVTVAVGYSRKGKINNILQRLKPQTWDTQTK